jgi:3-deoxy-D-manno-octulosonate 8-phosphate phosphatase (KDO 8-P phosphatase)
MQKIMNNYLEKLKKVTTFIFDIDGVLTDGTVTILPTGEQVRKMLIKDGYAMQHAIKNGFLIALISGGKSQSVVSRLQGLGVKDIYLGVENKMEKYEELKMIYEITDEEILYMGDDLPDYEVMKKAGVAVCPADAAHEIQEISDYVSPFQGGRGAVRDIIEKTLRLKNYWK